MGYKLEVFRWKIIKYLDIHFGICFRRKKYNGKQIMSIADTNLELARLIESGKPFAAARIGGTELKAMVACQKEQTNEKKFHEARSLLICLSGFFGDDEQFRHFDEVMEQSLASVDLLGVWYNQMEDYMIKHYAQPSALLGRLEGLEPWYSREEPWSRLLAGKRVVCVHPFKDSIEGQYKKREELFKGTELLPEFSFRCVKAVQTLYGEEDSRFKTWFDALDYMFEEVMKEDFDIALVSCGAYGLPLAARIKEAGKQAIHMGGALQLLFGVKGSRWDDFEPLNDLYSDAWVYPLESEHLSKRNSEGVESGCYW